MTPLELSILLHYYCRADDFRDGDFSAPAVREAIDIFRSDPDTSAYQRAGMLKPSPVSGQTYTLTDRARFYIDHLLSQPLPVCRWSIPARTEEPK